MNGERLNVRFALQTDAAATAARWARAIAVEQTVEIPEACITPSIEERVVGRVESLEPLPDGRFEAWISYEPALVLGDLAQLVNLLYGNVSLMTGVALLEVEWPETVLSSFRGPAFGIEGLRELCDVAERALVCGAIKPVGMTAEELARDAGRFAEGGADIIKDDHSLANQASAPFRERVLACHETVSEVNAGRARPTWYFPHLFGSPSQLQERAQWLREIGCRGVMVSPALLGWEAVRWLADHSGLALLAHPTATGSQFQAHHGVDPTVFLGQLFRIAGSDGVIFVNAGGRFDWSIERCASIHRALRGPLGRLRSSFPVPAGGMQAERVPDWLAGYGNDTMVLIGGSLYESGDVAEATRRLVSAVQACA